MDLHLSGRTALVTGASRGIGLAVAEALAREGCRLHVASRVAADLEAARERIRAHSPVEIDCHPVDLGAPGGVAALFARCGAADILVNNAGAIPQGGLLAVDEARWRLAWDLKVFGYIDLARACYGPMCDRGSGVIINIIGTAGERPSGGYIAGAAGNAALMAFSRALGGESVDHGVRVVGVNPGRIETDRQRVRLEERAQAQFGDPARWRELVTGAPFGRLGRPGEVADVVAFLASGRASYVSGTIVTIDGGRMSRLKDT